MASAGHAHWSSFKGSSPLRGAGVARPPRSGLAMLAFLLALPFLAAVVEGRTDPNTGRIRLLHIGLAFLRPDHPDPVFMMDPKIDLTMVPAFESVMDMDEVRRMIRLYLPRTRNQLDGGYDLVLIDGVDAFHIRDEFLKWVADLVQDSDLGFVMSDSGSGWSFAGSGTSWYITSVERILPVDDAPGREAASPGYAENNFRLVPVDTGHELMRNIPWDEMRFIAMNRPTARPGSRIVAMMSDEKAVNRGKPAIVFADYPSGGRSVAYIFTWHTMVGAPLILEFYRWKWHYDVLVHAIYWPAGEPIPEDLALVHSIRDFIGQLYYSRIYVLSVVDFAEATGADLRQIEIKLGSLEARRREIDRLYVDNEMETCHALCLQLAASYDHLIEETLKAKDRALFWIFVAEWSVVTAASMVTGAVVWTVLVRRRLYREAGVTRIRMDC